MSPMHLCVLEVLLFSLAQRQCDRCWYGFNAAYDLTVDDYGKVLEGSLALGIVPRTELPPGHTIAFPFDTRGVSYPYDYAYTLVLDEAVSHACPVPLVHSVPAPAPVIICCAICMPNPVPFLPNA